MGIRKTCPVELFLQSRSLVPVPEKSDRGLAAATAREAAMKSRNVARYGRRKRKADIGTPMSLLFLKINKFLGPSTARRFKTDWTVRFQVIWVGMGCRRSSHGPEKIGIFYKLQTKVIDSEKPS
jgi:hypothetical protein